MEDVPNEEETVMHHIELLHDLIFGHVRICAPVAVQERETYLYHVIYYGYQLVHT